MKNFLQIISNEILKRNPNLTKGFFPARIDSEGRVLIQSESNSNEFVYSGIKDNESNYFYIRHRDSGKIRFEESVNTKRAVAFQSYFHVVYEFRVVVVQKNVDSYALEELTRSSLVGAQLNNCRGIMNPDVKLRESTIDSITVLKEESNKAKTFDKNFIFVAIDFDLEFDQDQNIIDFCNNPCQSIC